MYVHIHAMNMYVVCMQPRRLEHACTCLQTNAGISQMLVSVCEVYVSMCNAAAPVSGLARN